MTTKWGTREDTDDDSAGSRCAEPVFVAIGAVCLSTAVVAILFGQKTGVHVPHGVYAILAGGMVIGIDGWFRSWLLRREHRATRRYVAEELDVVRQDVDELRQDTEDVKRLLEQLLDRLDESRPRPRPARGCRHVYVSQAAQVDTVRIRQASVDAATDPAGVSPLQRAHEAGVEKGFDIGVRTQLAEMGVPSLPPQRPRVPRLTGDS
ncbi:hypothetical protein [Micromonospora aurantiaca (nom. illeg.)]|uniref:hypothetical protein n=1 Tax=Micromonospora aurantiaca (nom. illeg.) TaxID=47850 RepID=UPI0033FA14D4